MGDTLALYKIKLQDLVSPQLQKLSKRLDSARAFVNKFGTDSDKGLGKAARKLTVVNNLGRLAAARNGMASFSSISRLAASGMNPLVVGLGIAGAGAIKLGIEMTKTGEAIQKNLQITHQLLGVNEKDTARLTTKAMALSKVYGSDYTSTIQTASKLARQFGISNDKAFSLIKQGFASGANISGDFLQSVEDSASVFKKLGASADQQMSILQQSISKGIKDAPKLLESFNNNLPNLGGDVQRLLDQNFGKGFTQTLKKNLDSGKTTAVQALNKISQAVANTKISGEATEGLAEQIFGDKSGSAVQLLNSFSKFETSLGSLVQKNSSFNKGKAEQLALEERLAQAQLKSSAGFASLANTGRKLMLRLKIGFYDAVNLAGALYGKITGLFSAASGLFTRVMAFQPVGIALKATWNALLFGLSTGFNIVKVVIGGVFDFVTNGLNMLSSAVDYVMGSALVQGITAGFSHIKEAVAKMLSYVTAPLNRLKDALGGIYTMLKGVKNFDYDQISAGMSEVKSGLSGATQKARERKEKIAKSGGAGGQSQGASWLSKMVKDTGKNFAKELDKKEGFKLSPTSTDTESPTKSSTNEELNRSTDKIMGGGSQVRHITVNIGELKGADRIVIEGAQGLDYKEAEQGMLDMLVRVIQGTERSISRG